MTKSKNSGLECWRGYEETASVMHFQLEYKMVQPTGKTIWHTIAIQSSRNIYLREAERYVHTEILASLFVITPKRKQPKFSLKSKGLNKLVNP